MDLSSSSGVVFSKIQIAFSIANLPDSIQIVNRRQKIIFLVKEY